MLTCLLLLLYTHIQDSFMKNSKFSNLTESDLTPHIANTELSLQQHWSSEFKIWDGYHRSHVVSGQTWLGYEWNDKRACDKQESTSTSSSSAGEDDMISDDDDYQSLSEARRISRICLELPMIVQSLNPDAKDFEPKSYSSDDPPKLDQDDLIQSASHNDEYSCSSVPSKIRVVVKKMRVAPTNQKKRKQRVDKDRTSACSVYYPADPHMPEGGIYFPPLHGMVSNKYCAFTLPQALHLDFVSSHSATKESPKVFTYSENASPRHSPKIKRLRNNKPPRMLKMEREEAGKHIVANKESSPIIVSHSQSPASVPAPSAPNAPSSFSAEEKPCIVPELAPRLQKERKEEVVPQPHTKPHQLVWTGSCFPSTYGAPPLLQHPTCMMPGYRTIRLHQHQQHHMVPQLFSGPQFIPVPPRFSPNLPYQSVVSMPTATRYVQIPPRMIHASMQQQAARLPMVSTAYSNLVPKARISPDNTVI